MAPVSTGVGELLLKIRLAGVFTVVVKLAQLVLTQPLPGVAGAVPPLGSTDA